MQMKHIRTLEVYSHKDNIFVRIFFKNLRIPCQKMWAALIIIITGNIIMTIILYKVEGTKFDQPYTIPVLL